MRLKWPWKGPTTLQSCPSMKENLPGTASAVTLETCYLHSFAWWQATVQLCLIFWEGEAVSHRKGGRTGDMGQKMKGDLLADWKE